MAHLIRKMRVKSASSIFRRAAEYGLLQIILTVVLLMKSSTAFFTHLRGQRLQCQTLSTSAQLIF
eukprot:COSAG03_NODE_12335_length_551_cov_2.842920_2_plen_64_part_01